MCRIWPAHPPTQCNHLRHKVCHSKMSHRLQDKWHYPLLYQDRLNHLHLQDKVHPHFLFLQDKDNLQDKCLLLHNHLDQDRILHFQDKDHLLQDK